MNFKLSPSALNLFKDCPRCFWLAQHKVWKRPTGPMSTLPSGMDKILKVHFNTFRDKGELPPEIAEHKDCEGMKLFGDEELLKTWQNNFRGIQWKDEEGNIFKGAVDNILTKGDKLIVLDYKTKGYPIKEDAPENYKHQVSIYNYLLKKNGYEVEDYGFLLFYVPDHVTETGEVVFDTTLTKVSSDSAMVEKLFKDAITLLNSECPKRTCYWCRGWTNEKKE